MRAIFVLIILRYIVFSLLTVKSYTMTIEHKSLKLKRFADLKIMRICYNLPPYQVNKKINLLPIIINKIFWLSRHTYYF